jgi:hypothetical protein
MYGSETGDEVAERVKQIETTKLKNKTTQLPFEPRAVLGNSPSGFQVFHPAAPG